MEVKMYYSVVKLGGGGIIVYGIGWMVGGIVNILF